MPCVRSRAHRGGGTSVVLDDVLALLRLRVDADDQALIVAADGGNPQAQCDLALLHLEQDLPETALVFLRHSAQNWSPEGMYWLGRCLISGLGARPDEAAGVEWIAKAAQHGHAIGRRVMVYLEGDRPVLSPVELDAALDAIEREIVVKALRETAD